MHQSDGTALTDRISWRIFTTVMTPEAAQALIAENRMLKAELAELKEQLAWLKRQIFGSKSERFLPSDDSQTSLDLGVQSQETAPATEHISYDRTKPRKHTPHGREEIPAHLPRKEIVLEPKGDISGMRRIGEKVTEQLEYEPPKYCVTRFVRPVYAGVRDGARIVVCGELPPLCNDKGKYGASIIAHAVVSKFEDHTPIYRLRKQIKRDSNVDIPETSLDTFPEKAVFWVQPLAERLAQEAMNSGYVQMDESYVRVMIKPTHGKSTVGQMWGRHSPEKHIVIFDYDRSRSARVARRLLGDYEGILQTDGYAVYESHHHSPGIVHACCNAHARRGFEEALTNDKTRATYALKQYRKLFAVEREAKNANMSPDERLALRQEQALPIAQELKSWLDHEILNVRPKSTIGKAIIYCINRWAELTQYLTDGRIEISNNLIENCIRLLALGRKNWLFAGSEEGARRMATLYTIIGTCKLHNLNTFDYLTHVLRELPKRTSGNIDDLLPTNWRPNNP